MFNKGALAINSHLENYSGAIAASNARREVAEISRDIEKAEDLEGAYQRAAEADIYADDTRERFTTPVSRIATDMGSAALNIVTLLVNLVDSVTFISTILNGIANVVGAISSMVSTAVGWLGSLIPGASKKDESVPGVAAFFDDGADGVIDGKSRAGNFFSNSHKMK